ncbi:hypothetical protein [Nocardiopsis rhodophaea]
MPGPSAITLSTRPCKRASALSNSSFSAAGSCWITSSGAVIGV